MIWVAATQNSANASFCSRHLSALAYAQDNHHKTYVSNLNNALEGSSGKELQGYTLSDLVAAVGTGKLPSDVETKVCEALSSPAAICLCLSVLVNANACVFTQAMHEPDQSILRTFSSNKISSNSHC